MYASFLVKSVMAFRFSMVLWLDQGVSLGTGRIDLLHSIRRIQHLVASELEKVGKSPVGNATYFKSVILKL